MYDCLCTERTGIVRDEALVEEERRVDARCPTVLMIGRVASWSRPWKSQGWPRFGRHSAVWRAGDARVSSQRPAATRPPLVLLAAAADLRRSLPSTS